MSSFWKMIAQSVELHKVFFDNRNYRNCLFGFRIIGRYQFIKNSNATARLGGTRAKDLSLLRCCFYHLMSRNQRKILS